MSVSDALSKIKQLQLRTSKNSAPSTLIILQINLAKLIEINKLTRVVETLKTCKELGITFRNLEELTNFNKKSKSLVSTKSKFLELSKFSKNMVAESTKTNLVISIFNDENLHYDVALDCSSKLRTKLFGDRSVSKALYFLVHKTAPEHKLNFFDE